MFSYGGENIGARYLYFVWGKRENGIKIIHCIVNIISNTRAFCPLILLEFVLFY